MQNKSYHTYAWLDRTVPGIFKYGEVYFEFEPFYIGMGSGERAINESKFARNNDVSCRQHRIYSKGGNIHKVILAEGISKEIAFEIERMFVKMIGRIDIGTGPLLNKTDGGSGALNPSPVVKDALSIAATNYWTGKHHTEETKRLISESQVGDKNHMFGKHLTDEHKKKISLKLKGREGRKQSEETKLKISEAQSGEKSVWYGKKHSDETKKLMSIKSSGENNPSYGKKWYNDGVQNYYLKDSEYAELNNTMLILGKLKRK